MSTLLILDGLVVNEGTKGAADIFIDRGRIQKIDRDLRHMAADRVLEAGGKVVLPGMIDDQVHFRDPGFPEKGSIATESRAAVAGGITSFMDMPNTRPQTVNAAELSKKFEVGARDSRANYSFYLGATNDNIEEIVRVDPRACGVKVFMGASTGNMLVDREEALREIFQKCPALIATHCEDTPMIVEQERLYRQKYGEDMPIRHHAEIRSREACYKSSSMAVALAREYGSRLHVLHLSTADEMELFTPGPAADKRITAEVCVHHLFFSQEDYDSLGTRIKWNPSVKTAADREALRRAVNENRIDVFATDHAPHTAEEKARGYWSAPSGGPLVQHALTALLELCHQGVFTLETLVSKACHAPADCYRVKDRGYIREGYWADLVIVDLESPQPVTSESLLYQCGWSPFEGMTFSSRIEATLVNGRLAYYRGAFEKFQPGMALEFNR